MRGIIIYSIEKGIIVIGIYISIIVVYVVGSYLQNSVE